MRFLQFLILSAAVLSVQGKLLDFVSKHENVQLLDPKSGSLLAPLLQPRHVGTKSHENAREFIVRTMRSAGWTVQLHKFTQATPLGPSTTFTNIIATKYPRRRKKVIYAAHYDTKRLANDPDRSFVGATDSAFPCALLLYLASTLPWSTMNGNMTVTPQFIFFDGEEAFDTWSEHDSLYGSKRLASDLGQSINDIQMFILLDLLGTASPAIKNFFPEATGQAYARLAAIDATLYPRQTPFFQHVPGAPETIEDDHLPFIEAGVQRVLHVITYPFPDVWHTLDDDAAHLDVPTLRRWARIFQAFIAEQFNMVDTSASNPKTSKAHAKNNGVVNLVLLAVIVAMFSL